MTDELDLSRDQRTELFLLQVRGQMALAFSRSGVVPTNDEWCILRGVDDPTVRQMGEIAWRTGLSVHMQLHDLAPARPTAPATGEGSE